ncbi:MAG: hypothetical protein ACYC3S_13270 [Chloroflexota bacterium]
MARYIDNHTPTRNNPTRNNPDMGDALMLALFFGGILLVMKILSGGPLPRTYNGDIDFGKIGQQVTGGQEASQQLAPSQVDDYLNLRNSGQDIAVQASYGEPGKIVDGTLHWEVDRWCWAEWGANGQLVTKCASQTGFNALW